MLKAEAKELKVFSLRDGHRELGTGVGGRKSR